MKKLLLSAAFVAIAAPAWGQVQSDYSAYNEYSSDIYNSEFVQSCLDLMGSDFDHDGVVLTCPPRKFETANEIILSATKIGFIDSENLTTASAVITETDIRARNQAVIADLLRTVPGLAVSQNGGAGSLTQIRLRGSEANHVVVIIDGVELANPADGAFAFGVR